MNLSDLENKEQRGESLTLAERWYKWHTFRVGMLRDSRVRVSLCIHRDITQPSRDTFYRTKYTCVTHWNDNLHRARSPWPDVRMIGITNLAGMTLAAPLVGLFMLQILFFYKVGQITEWLLLLGY